MSTISQIKIGTTYYNIQDTNVKDSIGSAYINKKGPLKEGEDCGYITGPESNYQLQVPNSTWAGKLAYHYYDNSYYPDEGYVFCTLMVVWLASPGNAGLQSATGRRIAVLGRRDAIAVDDSDPYSASLDNTVRNNYYSTAELTNGISNRTTYQQLSCMAYVQNTSISTYELWAAFWQNSGSLSYVDSKLYSVFFQKIN